MKFISLRNLFPINQKILINKNNIGSNRSFLQKSIRTPNNIRYSNLTNRIHFSNFNNTFNSINSNDNIIYYNNINNNFNNNLFNEKYDFLNTKKSIASPVINLELEFNLLKNKFNKNILNKTDNNLDLSNFKINFNRIQEKEKHPKTNINNYLYINNKFKYSKTISNNNKNNKHIKNVKYFKIPTKSKQLDNFLTLDNKKSEEKDEDELSELANQIIKSKESSHKEKKIKLICDTQKNLNNKNFNKINFNNYINSKNLNYSINNVNSLFIFNKKEINENKKELLIPQNVLDKNINNIYSIEKLNIEINSKTNSKYYENKKILYNENPKNLFLFKNEKNRISNNIENNKYNFVPENILNININPKIKNSENINNKDKKVKFDGRILTIYYNEKDKVQKLNIKDNKNKKIDFVPLNIKEYLDLLTSNKKLKPAIVLKNTEKKNIKDDKSLLKNKVKKLYINNNKNIKKRKIIHETFRKHSFTNTTIEKSNNKVKNNIKKRIIKK